MRVSSRVYEHPGITFTPLGVTKGMVGNTKSFLVSDCCAPSTNLFQFAQAEFAKRVLRPSSIPLLFNLKSNILRSTSYPRFADTISPPTEKTELFRPFVTFRERLNSLYYIVEIFIYINIFLYTVLSR